MKEFDSFQVFKKLLLRVSNDGSSKAQNTISPPNWSTMKYIPNRGLQYGIHESYVIDAFYNLYCYDFSIDFLKQKANDIADKSTKEWVNFCIDRLPDLIEFRKQDFLDELSEWSDKLKLNYDCLLNAFKDYLPFYTPYASFKFAYDNMGKATGHYFIVLLLMYIDPDIPQEGQYGITDPKKELYEFQKDLTLSFVDSAPFALKEKALLFLYEIFAKINHLNIYKQKFSLSYDKILYDTGKPLTGFFFLRWDKVDFFDGFYLLYHPSYPNGGIGHEPYRVVDGNSRRVFNDIQAVFLKQLPPVHVQAKNGRIVKVKNLANLTSCVTIMEHKVLAPAKEKAKGQDKQQKSITKEVTKTEADNIIRQLKSRFLSYLCSRQLDEYKVICCIENRVNSSQITSEYSFIFTIKESSTILYLAYENACDSRCTYLFPIPKHSWQRSIDSIYEFFASNEVNKRQSLSKRIAQLTLPGNYEYIRIMHSDYFNWVDRIKSCR